MAYTQPTNTDLLIAKVTESFPNLKFETFEHIKQGYDHDILIINNMVYRFPKTPYYLSQLESEIYLTEYLRKRNQLRIPAYNFISDDQSFARHPLLAGKEINATIVANLDAPTIKEITLQLATFLSSIHTIPESYYKKFGFNKNVYDKLIGSPPVMTPTHSDMDLNNILWDHKLGIGIIDFGDRSMFDPAFDFGIFFQFGESFVNQIYDSYTGPKDNSFMKRVYAYYDRHQSSS